MTAYVSRVFADRVEVMFDTAHFVLPDPALAMISSKGLQAGAMPLFVTGRGSTGPVAEAAMKLGGTIDNAGDVDDALASFTDFLAEQRAAGRTFPTLQDFLIAGWSPKRGYFHRHIATGKFAEGLGVEPFVSREVGPIIIGGTFDYNEYAAAGFCDDDFADGLSVAGVRLMQGFRTKPTFLNGQDDPMHLIGGHLLLVTIRETGCEMKDLGYWQDALGERIDPDKPFIRRTY